jgi:hypothetical protein
VDHGLLLEVFGLSQDELTALHTEASSGERSGFTASISPITRSHALNQSSEQVETSANRLSEGSTTSWRITVPILGES